MPLSSMYVCDPLGLYFALRVGLGLSALVFLLVLLSIGWRYLVDVRKATRKQAQSRLWRDIKDLQFWGWLALILHVFVVTALSMAFLFNAGIRGLWV